MVIKTKNGRRYSEQERESAIRIARKTGTKNAATELGISVNTLQNWMVDANIADGKPLETSKGYPQEFRDQVVAKAKQASCKKAADHFGVSRTTVLKWFRAEHPNQPKRAYRHHTADAKALALARAAEIGFIRAADELDIPETSLRSWDKNARTRRVPKQRTTHEQRNAIVETARALGTAEAARVSKVDFSTVRRWQRKAGDKRAFPLGGRTSDLKLTWVEVEHPSLDTWRLLAIDWLEVQTTAVRGKLDAIRRFFQRYLSDLGLPTEPAELLARNFAAPDFYAIACSTSKYGRSQSNYIYSFIEFVLAKKFSVPDDYGRNIISPALHNPVKWIGFSKIPARDESAFSPLPHGYIDELRCMIAEGPHFGDWTWAQSALGVRPTTRGATAADWFEVSDRQIDKTDPDCVWRVRPRSKGAGGPVLEMWSPVRWVALLIKNILPLRTTQVRQLDSGEFDPLKFVYSPDLESRAMWIENKQIRTGLARLNKQSFGVFRREERSESEYAILYINTNKTADSQLSGSAKGYEMPWPSLDPIHNNPFYWLAKLRDWQSKYNPVVAPTSWTELDGRHIVTKSAVELARFPDTSFLFRLREGKPGEQHLPITKDMLSRAWYLLLSKLEARLAKRGETHANGHRIRLVRTAFGVEFPLHSLRVSLITALIIDGRVAVHIMQKLVGHSRLLMTLYYTKAKSSLIIGALRDASELMRSKAEAGITDFLLTSPHVDLERNGIWNNPETLRHMIPIHPANRNAAGWMAMAHGTCLVGGNATQLEGDRIGGCYNGGPNMGSKTNPQHERVPGGTRNCIRCRWFVTRPDYLPALVAHFNILSFHVDKASENCLTEMRRLEALKLERALLEESGGLFERLRDLKTAERAHEAFAQILNERLLDLAACLDLIKRCEKHLDTASGNGKSLIAVGTNSDLRIVMKDSESELLQLSEVCEAKEIFPEWEVGNAIFLRSQLLDAALHREGRQPVFMQLSERDQLRCANAYLRELGRAHNNQNEELGRREIISIIDSGESLGALLGIELTQSGTIKERSSSPSRLENE